MPLTVAVIGSGPAGLYSAAELVRKSDAVVDVIDRIPAPYGLVRYGVAPDHPRIKAVIKSLKRTLEHERVRFLGNVEFGLDIDRGFLDTHYDATIYATGALHSNSLGIEGEQLSGSRSASDFVSWYNGHPDATGGFDLNSPAAVVVGAGNVALDVARLLTRQVGSLAVTDIPASVLEAFAASSVQDVHILCRRGARDAKFTTKELLDLRELPGVGVVVDPAEVQDAPSEDPDGKGDANVRIFRAWASDQQNQLGEPRRIHIHFWSRPAAIAGTDRVEEIKMERTTLAGDETVRGTGEFRTLAVGVVLSSVGYRSNPLLGLPYDPSRGVLPNVAGRVVGAEGNHIPSLYVAGWLKRGPQGVIGTNKACAAETVAAVLEDLASHSACSCSCVDAADRRLTALGAEVVDYGGWRLIDAQELQRGQESGRDRVKITEWAELRAIGAGRPGP